VRGERVTVSTTVGIRVFPEDAGDFGTLVHTADRRMHEEKPPR
jgi:hypothetical protein